jgi:prevent-host-death family protein
MEVGIRELKARLSSYVARARRGETVVVTDRGRPVARLQAAEMQPPAAVRDMVAAGRLIYKGQLRSATLPPPMMLHGAGKDSTEYVRDGRR